MKLLYQMRLAWLSVLLFGCSSQQSELIENGWSSKQMSEDTAAYATQDQRLEVAVGPTRIPLGDARGEYDITVSNQYFAIAFAVDTPSPWGVAKGGIIDVSVVTEGQLGNDFASLIDFMPNYWSAWPSTYQKIEIEQQTAQQVVVKTERDWGEVSLVTRFEVSRDSRLIRINTSMRNLGPKPLADLQTGYAVWPNGGHLFGMPGITEDNYRPTTQDGALAQWSASYDEDWALGLHTPFSNLIAYNGRDRYLFHTLEPQQTREFEAWVQIEPNADIARFTSAEIKRRGLPFGQVSGFTSNSSGQPLESGAVVVQQHGKLHSWGLIEAGQFKLDLPEGEYQLSAIAARHAPGKASSIEVLAQQTHTVTLDSVQAPAQLDVELIDQRTAEPINGMITIIEGLKPTIKYFGQARYFTDLDSAGQIKMQIAPGEYKFEVASGGGFLAKPSELSISLGSGEQRNIVTEIRQLPSPAARNWFSADMHHHSDVLDGFTPPQYVMRAQLAAGLDVSFLSDHDSTANNLAMQELSKHQEMPFIAGTELSASWGHFNAYPIDVDKTPASDVGLFNVQDLFAEARRIGAEVIHVNHPYGNYGYFESLKQSESKSGDTGSSVPGGLDLGFDLIEITTEHEMQTLQRAWQYWNQGKSAYFAAGSDVHDVWNTPAEHFSGAARSYVYVEGDLSAESFVQALKAGKSYATQGPIIYPEIVFGSRIEHLLGKELALRYEVQSVVGIDSIQLIEQGSVVERRTLNTGRDEQQLNENTAFQSLIEFSVIPQQDTWYSLVVADIEGNYAYSNPIWVNASKTH